MRFMQNESVLQSKNRSGPAKNRFSVALVCIFWKHYSMVKPHFSNIRIITAFYFGAVAIQADPVI